MGLLPLRISLRQSLTPPVAPPPLPLKGKDTTISRGTFEEIRWWEDDTDAVKNEPLKDNDVYGSSSQYEPPQKPGATCS